MAKCMKCGGAKMAAGGYVPGKTSPLYTQTFIPSIPYVVFA